ncbi:sensor histidine kinase [Humibacter ginsenosidimutans]|nr:HAMP domain-containing sensor histidine kinase [Humibacter ginsenosidimutans]
MRRRRETGADADAIARASRLVTAQITAVAAGIVVLVVVLSVAFIIDQSQPSELLEKPGPGQTKIYVDADEVLIALIVTGVVAIVLAGLLSWVIARRAVRPLGEALRIQRTFVADASHELRTPVAVIAARVELLAQETEADADTADSIAGLRRDVRVLGDVITDLLLAAAPPSEIEPLEPTVVGALTRETVDDLRMVAAERNVTLELAECSDEILTKVPRSTMRRCVVALVDNAIGHSPAGGVVEVTVGPAPERASFCLTVRDHGTGISGIDPVRVFERFAHGDGTTRQSARTGFGIGLSLVRDMADRYGGRIEVAETSATGTTFVLTLPRA